MGGLKSAGSTSCAQAIHDAEEIWGIHFAKFVGEGVTKASILLLHRERRVKLRYTRTKFDRCFGEKKRKKEKKSSYALCAI